MISPDHLHPMLVHFPIAFVLLGFLAEVLSIFFRKQVNLNGFSYYLLIIGTFTSLIAVLTGSLFTSEMTGAAGDIKETHEVFAWLTVSLLLVTSLVRIVLKVKNKESSNLKWLALLLYGLSVVFVSITGFYGGTLVYNYMMPI